MTPEQLVKKAEGLDIGNKFLAPVPCSMKPGRMRLPDGTEWLIVTWRTPDTTFTLLLDKETGRAWGESLIATSDGMSGLITGNGQVPR